MNIADLIGWSLVRPPSLPGRSLLGWFLRGLVFGIALRIARRIPLRQVGSVLLGGAAIVLLTAFFYALRNPF
jgi:hypothetical protein